MRKKDHPEIGFFTLATRINQSIQDKQNLPLFVKLTAKTANSEDLIVKLNFLIQHHMNVDLKIINFNQFQSFVNMFGHFLHYSFTITAKASQGRIQSEVEGGAACRKAPKV